MKKLIFINLIMILFYCGCSDNITLEMAYQKKSNEKLDKFLKNWVEEYKPLTDVELTKLSPAEQNAYSLYEEFYKQNDNFENSFTSESLYRKTNYFLVQNRLFVFLYDDLDLKENISLSLNSLCNQETYEKFIINDFRPNIKNTNDDILYITDKYREILREYLLGEYMNAYDIKINFDEKDELFNRVRFIVNQISIFPSHWDSYWRIESHPIIETINLNKNFDNAIVTYSIEYAVRAVIFKKINNNWEMGKSELYLTQ